MDAESSESGRPARRAHRAPRFNIDSPLTGLLIVDKPIGISSMAAVRVVRRRAGNAKTGHAGTLDPLATGVLLMCIGRAATRLVPELMNLEKRYIAEIDLTAFSTTDDAEGELTPASAGASSPTREEIDEALAGFIGEIMQRPPAYSAMKVGGRRAYKMARRGEQVELAPRPVRIRDIQVLDYMWPRLRIDVRCGKGTYIRSLARDIGVALGTGGYLTALRRTAIGPYTIDRAVALDDVPDPLTASNLLPIPAPE